MNDEPKTEIKTDHVCEMDKRFKFRVDFRKFFISLHGEDEGRKFLNPNTCPASRVAFESSRIMRKINDFPHELSGFHQRVFFL